MDPTQTILIDEPMDFNSYKVDKSEGLLTKLLRYYIAVVFIAYAIVASVLEINIGFYAIKLFLLGSVCLLLLSPANYSYLLGLIISMYYLLKPHQIAPDETTFVVKYLVLITIFMTCVNLCSMLFGNKRNPYHKFDFGSFCLFGLIPIVLLGFFTAINKFLYARRAVEIIGYACAYSLGKSYLKDMDDLKMLMKGLCLGMFAFTWPATVGYVMRKQKIEYHSIGRA